MSCLLRKCAGVGLAVLVGSWLPAMTGCTDAELSDFLSDLGASLDINVTIDDDTNGGGSGSDDESADDSSNSDDGSTDDSTGGTDDSATGTDDGSTDGGTDDGSGGGDEIRYAASLSGGGSASGSAVWRVRTDRVVFKVEVESGVPGASLDIVVDGVSIASLTLDATGFGEVEYRDPPDNNPDPNEFPLPDSFPADVGDGSTVSVGELSGVLAES